MTALKVRYSFEQDEPKSIIFAQEIEVSWAGQIGIVENLDRLKRLFWITGEFIDKQRTGVLKKLRERLATAEALLKTKLLNDWGRSVLNLRAAP